MDINHSWYQLTAKTAINTSGVTTTTAVCTACGHHLTSKKCLLHLRQEFIRSWSPTSNEHYWRSWPLPEAGRHFQALAWASLLFKSSHLDSGTCWFRRRPCLKSSFTCVHVSCIKFIIQIVTFVASSTCIYSVYTVDIRVWNPPISYQIITYSFWHVYIPKTSVFELWNPPLRHVSCFKYSN